MKPLHVLDMSVPHVAGYTSRAGSILAGQRLAGMEPLAVTGVRHGKTAADPEELGGIQYHRTQLSSLSRRAAGVPGVGEALEMAVLARRIASLYRAGSFDLVHAHSPILCGLPAHAVALSLGLPSVYEVRAFWEDAAVNLGRIAERSARYDMVRNLETALAQSVDALVVLCEGLRRDLCERGLPSERIFTVPNGVDASRFAPMPRDEAFAARLGFGGKVVLAYIGTFFRFEGVAFLLRALARMTERDDSVRGLVVGHGETEEELRDLHQRLGLDGKVLFVGRVQPADIARYYAVSDVLCYPRERHRITELTTPLKPLEAMSMEKAVLASDVGGLRELVDDEETGLLFRALDVDDFVRQAERLVRDAALRRRLGEESRHHVVVHRDWSKLARRYLEVYSGAREHAHWRLRRAA